MSASPEYKKKWYQANREKVRQQQKEYYFKNAERLRKKAKKWRKNNKEAKKNSELQNKYGISVEQFNVMLVEQNGVCAICEQVEQSIDPRTNTVRTLAVDHCHVTGRIRGLLCSHCNRAVGLLKENIKVMKSMISYLERFSDK